MVPIFISKHGFASAYPRSNISQMGWFNHQLVIIFSIWPVFRIHLAGDWRVGVGHNDAIKLLGPHGKLNWMSRERKL